MNRIARVLLGGFALAGLLVLQPIGSAGRAWSYTNMTPMQRRLVSGTVREPTSDSASASASSARRNYFPGADECQVTAQGSNTKVNQNCLNVTDPDLQGRAQSQNETFVAQDPNDPSRLIVTANDYRRGDGNCGAYYSRDRGSSFNDSAVPQIFTRGQRFGAERQYWGGGGDTSVAFDTKGNAYLSCQVFNRGAPPTSSRDLSSALLVFRSTKNGGASWNFPGRYVAAVNDVRGTGTTSFLDKQFLTVDNHAGSPYQDRIYVSWTTFAADGSAYIFDAFSKDYGETFSKPVLVSSGSPHCTNDFGVKNPNGPCTENQFSQPFTAPDGTLYVVYANFNSEAVRGNENHDQILLAKSTDGGATFGTPVKVSDYYELPDCVSTTGHDAFSACVPTKGDAQTSYFRASNYPSGAVNPQDPSQVVVTFGSYINTSSKASNGCVSQGFDPDTGLPLYKGVTTPDACNNDIVISVSNNRGNSFAGGATNVRNLPSVTQDAAQANTDQFFQWAAFSEGTLGVAYFDRQYDNDEFNGFSDISLSQSASATTFQTQRVTSSSMPPPTQFEGEFLGDYIGMSADSSAFHPAWPDTRRKDVFICPGTATPTRPPALCNGSADNAAFANDQDIYTASVPRR